MKGSELPTAVLAFFSIDMPDVVSLRLGFLPFLVEPRDEGLVPQIVPNLFHGYLVVGEILSRELWNG